MFSCSSPATTGLGGQEWVRDKTGGKQTNIRIRGGRGRLVTEAIQEVFFPSLGCLHLHLCTYIIKVGRGGDLISVLYLAN